LPPRRDPLSPGLLAKLRRWCAAQSGDAATAFRVLDGCEWVSCDSRAVPHTVCLVVQSEGLRRHLVIEKASARIVESDLRAALPSGVVMHSCPAMTS
jgi:hypothetical protein